MPNLSVNRTHRPKNAGAAEPGWTIVQADGGASSPLGARFAVRQDASTITFTSGQEERDWPPELVAELISSYELPPAVDTGKKARVTKVGDACVADTHPRPAVARWEKSGRPGVIGDVHFDLPINGIWSDLTAISFGR